MSGFNFNWSYLLKALFSSAQSKENAHSSESSQKPQQNQHTVKSGDTLTSIARNSGVSVADLKTANKLKNDAISPGQIITIPAPKPKTEVFESKIQEDKGMRLDKAVPEEKIKGPTGLFFKPSIHVIKKGETLSKIEKEYGLLPGELKSENPDIGKTLSIGQKITIPEHIRVHNVKTTADAAKATGLSVDFLKKLESFEDKNHSMNGKPTIGIGHYPFSDFEKKYYKNVRLNDAQINQLLTKDIIKAQSKIKQQIGEDAYKKLNQNQREALTDFVFNRGEGTFASSDCAHLRKALIKGDYSKAAASMDHIREYGTKNNDFGLAKRRLFEISHFCDSKFDKTVVEGAQRIYDLGRKAADAKGTHKNIIYGNNKEINEMFDGKLKLRE